MSHSVRQHLRLEIDAYEEWAEEDTYLPLDAELEALARIGFDAKCVWAEGPMCVVAAVRG